MTDTAENTSVPVEFKAGKDGFYKFAFNFDSNEFNFVQLEDRLLKTTMTIKPSTVYRFKASIKDNADRFVLHFTTDDVTIENKLTAFVYMEAKQVVVDLRAVAVQTEVAIFDISGKLLLRKELEGLEAHKLNVNATTQILLVRLKNEIGVLNTKVLYFAEK
jgi:hypothetical protein